MYLLILKNHKLANLYWTKRQKNWTHIKNWKQIPESHLDLHEKQATIDILDTSLIVCLIEIDEPDEQRNKLHKTARLVKFTALGHAIVTCIFAELIRTRQAISL